MLEKAPKYILKERRWGYLFVAAPFIQFLIFGMIPVAISVYASFTNWSVLTSMKWIGLQNYKELFGDENFWKALYNTIFYFIGVPIGMAISLGLALLMKKDKGGNSFFRIIYYLPSISSIIAISVLWSWIYNADYGLFNILLSGIGIKGPNWLGDPNFTKPSLIILGVWGGLGPMIIMFIAALKNIPVSFYEAAKIDGSGSMNTFRYITFPMLKPVLFYLMVLGFIANMQTFGSIFVMLPGGGPEYSGASIVYYLWQKGMNNFQMGYASAMAWILALITFVVTFIQFRLRKSDTEI